MRGLVHDTMAKAATAGKYLTFCLEEEHYGLEIMRVQEIVGLLPVTRVPRLPHHIAGVVNLRGRVVPVMDLRLAFGLPDPKMNERTCIVVVHTIKGDGSKVTMGVLVDEVSDVVDLAADRIEDTPEFGTEVDTDFIKGVGRLEERVVLLLDIDLVLSVSDMEAIEKAADIGSLESEGDN